MSGHTPGPWCVAPLDGVYHGDDSTKYHAVKRFWPGPGAYERVADCSDSANPEANAKLIAAAPCLAKALHEVMKMIGCECDCIHSDDSNPTQCPCKLARAALAKAGVS